MIYLVTQKGVNKAESEDAILVGHEVISDSIGEYEIPQSGFVCVADGVGGHNGGRIASHYVLEALSNCAPEHNQLRDAVIKINTDMLNESAKRQEINEMATTLSGIYLSGKSASIVHIGNTRIYAKQGNYLKQLTSDHTVYEWLRSLGRFEEAENCKRNEIVACLGGGELKLAERLTVFELDQYSTLLFTTDGIHDHISLDLLEDLISSGKDGLTICEEIMAAAVAAESKDDLTVMLFVRQEENDGIPV